MGIKRIVSIIFQIPAWLLLIISLIGSIYGYVTKMSGINLATPIILFFVLLLYIIGRVFLKEKKEDYEETPYFSNQSKEDNSTDLLGGERVMVSGNSNTHYGYEEP
jgi:hypothetical protein